MLRHEMLYSVHCGMLVSYVTNGHVASVVHSDRHVARFAAPYWETAMATPQRLHLNRCSSTARPAVVEYCSSNTGLKYSYCGGKGQEKVQPSCFGLIVLSATKS